MFGFGKRKKAKPPSWGNLTPAQKALVTKRIVKALQSGPRYKLVSGSDEWQRAHGSTEHGGEDEILSIYSRGRMINQARNAMRNSPTFSGILKQYDLNAIGTQGGKALLNFANGDKVQDAFSIWTRNADFFDGLEYNTLLKIILKTYIIGGDCVLLFDDGLIEDSGKLLIYEPDEIADTKPDALEANYGALATQSQGRVYNGNGRFIGCIVSRSQRGADVFEPEQSYFLHTDPDADYLTQPWIMPRNVFRVAQGRGVTPFSSSLATIIDLEEILDFEKAASKKNAQTLAQVIQDSQATAEDTQLPSAFDAGTDFEGMTDAEIEQAAQAETEAPVINYSLDQVRNAGAIYEVMPEGTRLELLDTKRPNDKMPDFINFLATRGGAPLGLSQQFCTNAPSGADYRANMIFTTRAMQEAQKFLERISDWVFFRWATWARRKGIINTTVDYAAMRGLSWAWPKFEELDELNHQNAVEKKLRNMTGSYKDELGSDWREKLLQIQEEIKWCKDNGILHPSLALKSGGESTLVDAQG